MPGKIMENAVILAISRDGSDKRDMEIYAGKLKDKYNAEIMFVEMPHMDISSSNIRKIISSGGNASMYLPDKVWEYIKSNRCYM